MDQSHRPDPPQSLTKALEEAFASGCNNVACRYTHGRTPDGKSIVGIEIERILGEEQEIKAIIESATLEDAAKVERAHQAEEGSYLLLIHRDQFEEMKKLGVFAEADALFEHQHTVPAPILRPARPDEFDAVFDILRACSKPGKIRREGMWHEEAEYAFHHKLFRENGMDFITIAEKPVGIIEVQEHPGTLYIAQFCITPDMQGKGIGGAVLEGVKSRAAANFLSVTLQTQKHNARAQALYARHGFTADGETGRCLKFKFPSP